MRLTGDQVITAGANGAALTMDMLDDLVDAVRGTPSVLVMNKAMRRAVVKLARSSQVLSITRDYFGREVEAYGGVPMAVIERSEEHTSELQSLMRISYAVFCLKKKNVGQKTKTAKSMPNTIISVSLL